MDFLTVDDLAPFATIEPAKAEAMIADVSAQAFAAAPCLAADGFGDDPQRVAAVKAILRAAVLRWHEAGTGALTQETAGPFSRSMDTRTERKGVFLPGELAALRDLCAEFNGGDGGGAKAYAIDTAGGVGVGNHSPICNLVFGGSWCSCGADLTAGRYPLWEGGLLS